jgi:SmpA/OmlA family protein
MVRFTNAFATGVLAIAFALSTGMLFAGCAHDSSSAPAKSEPAKAAPAKSEPVKGAAAPAGSKLAQIKNDMSPDQVQEIMGSPTGQSSYPTGKTFNPYNFGGDSGNRVEYKYKGVGRVVFAVPRYGGNMKVVRIDYDPTEDGN